jgi:uncharacterized protein YdaT
MGKNVHVVKHPSGWAAKKEGAQRASQVTQTQKQAIDAGRRIAKQEHSELIVHGRDNLIRQKDSFGRDPNPPKG